MTQSNKVSIVTQRFHCQITSFTAITNNTYKVDMSVPEDSELNFWPGQYLNIVLLKGQRIPFSIASSPSAALNIQLHIRYKPGNAVLQEILGEIQASKSLTVELPYGNNCLFGLPDKDVVLIAGGTGFAPCKSILEWLFTKECKQSVYLFWGAHKRTGLYMHEEVNKWEKEHDFFHYHPVVEEVGAIWDGKIGKPHEHVATELKTLSNANFYHYGPVQMIEKSINLLKENGVKQQNLHSDYEVN